MCMSILLVVFIVLSIFLFYNIIFSFRCTPISKIDHFTQKIFPPTAHIGPDGKTVVWDMKTGEHKPVYTLILTGVVSSYFIENINRLRSTSVFEGIVNYANTNQSDETIVYIDSKASAQILYPFVDMIKNIPKFACGLVSFSNNPPTASPILSLTSKCIEDTKLVTRQQTDNITCVDKKQIHKVNQKNPPPSMIFIKPSIPNFSWQPDAPPLEFKFTEFKIGKY